MVKAVIFDMDGTLIDSVDQHARAWQDAFQDFGHEFELKAIRAQIGKGGDQLLPVFLTREEIELKGRDLEKHRGNVLKERYLFQIKPFPKVTELFHRIRADNIKSSRVVRESTGTACLREDCRHRSVDRRRNVLG